MRASNESSSSSPDPIIIINSALMLLNLSITALISSFSLPEFSRVIASLRVKTLNSPSSLMGKIVTPWLNLELKTSLNSSFS